MNRLWICLFLCFCSPAMGQTVRVTSGEHAGFTRLVFDFGQAVDWQVGRSLDGYELKLAQLKPNYDLTNAFALIGKSRLAAIWVAPDTGQLHIGLACACHAIPFEFRSGIVVVDLKDGPPPTGSSFEMALDGSQIAPLAKSTPARPKRRPEGQTATPTPNPTKVGAYDWTADAYSALRAPSSDAPLRQSVETAPTVLPPDPGLQPLRDTLVHQMARGAAQGVVEMATTGTRQTNLPESAYPSAQIRIGDTPMSVNRPDRSIQGTLGAQGATCIPADQLEIASWGDETTPLADQITNAHSGLTGEFDTPDAEAIARAVRFQLFMGFGTEARQTLAAFSLPLPNAAAWRALSHLIDDGIDPESVFKGQAACGGPSALWALLGDSSIVQGDAIDTGAVRLAFSALPIHLRHLIGPKLAEKFLALGDTDSARAVRDAITRAPGATGDAIALMEAEIDLQAGDAPEAEHKAAGVISDPSQNHPEALVALTEARIAQRLPIGSDVALGLQAHLKEYAGTELEPRLQEALILAEAASGNFSAAFTGLKDHPGRQEDVWSLLATLGSDEEFLFHAVLAVAQEVPRLQSDTMASIARRLTGLGLPRPAQMWLSGVDGADPLLLAETALRNRDGRGALQALVATEGELAAGLKFRAFELLGEDQMVAEILSKAGDVAASAAALARSGKWEQLALSEGTAWKDLADQLTDIPVLNDGGLPNGLLARGNELAIAGAKTRSAIDALLLVVPTPEPVVRFASETASEVPKN